MYPNYSASMPVPITTDSEWVPSTGAFLVGAIGMGLLGLTVADPRGISLTDVESLKPVLIVVVAGALLELGRRLSMWAYSRLNFQYSVTASFNQGQEGYDWILHLMTSENVWETVKTVGATPRRKRLGAGSIPTDGVPRRWNRNGYRIDVTCSTRPASLFSPCNGVSPSCGALGCGSGPIITIKIHTFDKSALPKLMDAARLKYMEGHRSDITVHSTELKYMQDKVTPVWDVRRKIRQPALESIIRTNSLVGGMLEDAQEFLGMDEYYHDAGLPHRKGYLLEGTECLSAKRCAVYALAGELGMAVYSISLKAPFMDDETLDRAVAAIPNDSILLIENLETLPIPFPTGMFAGPAPISYAHFTPTGASTITLAGVQTALDQASTSEGILLFGTTNGTNAHLDLVRQGRFDLTLEFNTSTGSENQAAGLFKRIFPAKHVKLADSRRPPSARGAVGSHYEFGLSLDEKQPLSVEEYIADLAEAFAQRVPENEFSVSQLTGYLLTCKKQPLKAVDGVSEWVRKELAERAEKKEAEEARLKKERESNPFQPHCGPFPIPPPMMPNFGAPPAPYSRSRSSSTSSSSSPRWAPVPFPDGPLGVTPPM